MKAGRPKSLLTEKEEEIMQILWDNGPLYVRQIVEKYPEPKPHRNSVATIILILEQKGHVSRESGEGGVFLYRAVTQRDSVRKTRLGEFAANFFKGSYLGIVSELVKDEKISVDELKELIDMIESGNK